MSGQKENAVWHIKDYTGIATIALGVAGHIGGGQVPDSVCR